MKYLLLVISLFTAAVCKAQTPDYSLSLAVISPDVSADFNEVQIKKLESKLEQVINNSNQAVAGYNNDFVLYPVISIENSATVEGGMQNILVTTLDLSLFIKEASTNLIYNTMSIKLKGSGDNTVQSITNAISQIRPADPVYAKFIETAKTKILAYYSANCGSIIQSAVGMAAKDCEQAIGLLQSIPSVSGDCYQDAQKKSLEMYQKYQTAICTKYVQKAKSEIALKDYQSAQATLQLIDPASSCSPEVNKLIKQISAKIEKRDAQEVDLEKERINAVKEIAKAYYSNTIRLVSYHVIVH